MAQEKAALPEMQVEVLATGDGHTVARLSGTHIPVVIFHPEAITHLRVLFEAATMRLRSMPGVEEPDALKELSARFEAFLSLWDAEIARFRKSLYEGPEFSPLVDEIEHELEMLSRLVPPLSDKT